MVNHGFSPLGPRLPFHCHPLDIWAMRPWPYVCIFWHLFRRCWNYKHTAIQDLCSCCGYHEGLGWSRYVHIWYIWGEIPWNQCVASCQNKYVSACRQDCSKNRETPVTYWQSWFKIGYLPSGNSTWLWDMAHLQIIYIDLPLKHVDSPDIYIYIYTAI